MNTFSTLNPIILDKKRRLQVANKIFLKLKKSLHHKNTKDMKLLDIGCSIGIITNYLARHFSDAVGIDTDYIAIEQAKNKFRRKNLRYMVMDGGKTSFTNNTFDVATCIHVYYYIKDKEKLFQEIYRILKPGGICYLSGINKYFPVKPKQTVPTSYVSYWELEKLCNKFSIQRDMLDSILPNFKWIIQKPL